MRLFCLYSLLAVMSLRCATQPAPPLLPDYNSSFYSTVLDAAVGVGQPFLLQQGYLQLSGVTVSDTTLVYNDKAYKVYEKYENPGPGYYITSDQYPAFHIGSFQSVWPQRMPYALYDSATGTFHSTIDCVGYGTRLLSATGNSSPAGNAYLRLGDIVRGQNVTPFAAPGWVASAYEFAAAFPILTNTGAGWQYVAGNVNAHVIDSVNHTMRTTISTYTGAPKGGVANAIPGDILSFGYKPGGGSNGHFMVIQQKPYLLNADSLKARYFPRQAAAHIDNLLAQYQVYAVPLFDCSGDSAHFFDSRKKMSGIGHGTLLLLTDHATDTPQGFIFSAPKPAGASGPIGTERMGGHVVAITIGRYAAGKL